VCCAVACKQPAAVEEGNEKSGLDTIPELIVYNKTPDRLLQPLPDYLTRHIPEGYTVLDTCSADLNADGIQEFFLATHKPVESNRKQSFATAFEYSAADNDWIQTQEIQESYFMDKQEYKADTTTPKQFGRITFKKDCCRR
jgi:hypothetical protein